MGEWGLSMEKGGGTSTHPPRRTTIHHYENSLLYNTLYCITSFTTEGSTYYYTIPDYMYTILHCTICDHLIHDGGQHLYNIDYSTLSVYYTTLNHTSFTIEGSTRSS